MAIYQANYLSPENTAIDTSIANIFTARVNGTTIAKYQLQIYKMDNTNVYDSGETILSPVYYDKDTLYHSVPAISQNGQELKWTLTTWETTGSATSATTREVPFFAYSTPTATFQTIPSPITAKSYEFIVDYTQAESIPLEKWKMIWYDSDSNIIEETDWSFSGSVVHTFDGFSNNETYKIKAIINSQVGYSTDTGMYSFTVEYDNTLLNISASTELLEESGAIKVSWSEAIVIPAVYGGSSTPCIEDDFLYDDNHILQINSGDTIAWGVDIPLGFTCTFRWTPASGFDGIICNMDDSYIFGYTDERFYYTINEITNYSVPSTITGKTYLIALFPTYVYIQEIV